MTQNIRSTPAASTHNSMENQEVTSAKSEPVNPNAQPFRDTQSSTNRLVKAKLLGVELAAAQPTPKLRKALRDDEATTDTQALNTHAPDSLPLTRQETTPSTDTASDLGQAAKNESYNTDDERLQAQALETIPLIPTSTVAAWQVADNSPGLPEVLTAANTPTALPATAMGGWALGTSGILAGGALAVAAAGGKSNSSVPDTTAPVLQSVSARVLDNTITLTYDSALNAQHAPLASAFAISQGGVALAVQSIQISGATLTLVLSNSAHLQSGAYTITYNEPAVTDSQATQDLSGNHSASLNLVLDPLAPTITLSSDKSLLGEGQSSTITLTASESLRNLKLSDLSVTGGTLQNLQAGVDGQSYSATLTPNANLLQGSMNVSLATGAVTDFSGESNAASNTLAISVDKTPPQLLSISGSAASDTVELRFDVPLDANHLPQLSQFTITQGSQVLALESVSLIGSGYVLSVKVQGDLTANPFSVRYQDASTGNDTQAIQNTLGNDLGNFEQGLVADGSIKGARIYIDANRNGVADASEDTGVITDQYGRYILTNATQSGPIIAIGGVNTDTGIANTMALQAPEGSMVINPITSLVQSLALQKGLTTAQASSQIASALGLPPELDLSRFDPLAVVGDLGLAGQKIAAQIASLAHIIANAGGTASGTSVIADLALSLSDAPSPSTGTSVLDQAPLLQTLMHKAQVPQAQQSALLGELQQTIQDIHVATSISGISGVQSSALDNVTPAAPIIKMVMPTALGEAPQVVVAFNTNSTDGSAATVGDVLTVTVGTTSYTHTLTLSDIVKGETSVVVAMDTQMLDATATLTDRVGHGSAAAKAPLVGSDTIDLANSFGQPIQMMLQALGNQDLPMIGSLQSFSEQVWSVLKDLLSDLPVGHIKTAAAKPQLLTGLSIEELTGSTDPNFTITFDEPTTPTDTAATDNSGLPPYLQPATQDTSSTPVADPGSSTGGGSNSSTSGSISPNSVVLVGRNGGEQFEIPNLDLAALKDLLSHAFTMDVSTGIFKFNLKLPFRIFQKDMLGSIGVDGLQAKLDASIDSYAQVEINLEGKLDAKWFLVYDTEKTKLELTFDGGLKQGSSAAIQLGPLVVAASDMNSSRVAEDATRKNTGVTGSIDILLKDNDGTEDKQMTINVDSIAKFFNQIADNAFKISDWYALKADVQAQLSVQTLGRLDLETLHLDQLKLADLLKDWGLPAAVTDTASAFDGFTQQIASLMEILTPQISAKVLIPASVSYDSTITTASAWSSDYSKVYFDDIRIGAQALLSKNMEPGLELLNKVMAPMYAIEDFMSAPLPWPDSNNIFGATYAAPTAWPDTIENVANDLVNAPAHAAQSVLDSLKKAMDKNHDGKVSTFEALRGSVDSYHEMALKVAEYWAYFETIPGATAALTAAATSVGIPVNFVTGFLDIISSSVTRPPATTEDPTPLSPMEKIQLALDKAEQVLHAVDQLQSLQGLYDAAQTDLQKLADARLSAGDSSDLTISLGSYVWDIPNASFTDTRNAYLKKSIDYQLPMSAVDVQLMSQEDAIKLIYTQVKAGTASSKTLSVDVFVKAGVDFSQIADYKSLGITTGVDFNNIDAVCNILNARKDLVFSKDWSVDSTFSTSQESDRLAFTLDLKEILYYDRVFNLANNKPDFKGWDATTMADTLYQIGVITPTEREKADGSGWDWSYMGYVTESRGNDYKYGGKAATYILYDIMKSQDRYGIDTMAELKGLWSIEKKIEDLMANQTVSGQIRGWQTDNPDDSTLSKFFLTFDDFANIGLPILSASEDVRQRANEKIRDWSWDGDWMSPEIFAKVYGVVADIINTSNNAYLNDNGVKGSNVKQEILDRFMKLAAVDDDSAGDVNQITQSDFQSLGINTMPAEQLAMFASFLASSKIQADEVSTVAKISKLVDAVNTVVKTANDQSVEAKDFYSAIELLLGKVHLAEFTLYPDTQHSLAEFLNFIPRANIGGIDQLYSTETLPLFQAIIKRLSSSEVDSYTELAKLANITKDIELTTMKDDKVWETHGLGYYPIDLNKDIVNTFKNYKPALTTADLNLLGYKNLTDVNLSEIQIALGKFNSDVSDTYTTYSGGSFKSFTEYDSFATDLNNLDLEALDKVVGDYSNSGFLTELMSKSPAFKNFWDGMTAAGFALPFLSDPAVMVKLWTGQPLDLLTYNPDLSKFSYDSGNLSLFNTDLITSLGLGDALGGFVSVPLNASASVKIEPRLSFGVDTGGLIEAINLPDTASAGDVFKALFNGFYINDQYYVGAQWKDLPELAVNLNLNALMGISLGSPDLFANFFATLSSGLNLDMGLDLANAGTDGKVRLSNFLGDLINNPLDVLDLQAQLEWYIKAQAGAAIDLTPKDWGPLKNYSTVTTLLEALGTAAEWVTGQSSFKWAPEPLQYSQVFIDNNPNTTDIPSLTELIHQVI
jgi:hypothetical protein